MLKINLLNIISITKNLKVLYVEDNKKTRVQAVKMFENYFDYIDIAADGVEGLKFYENYFFDTNKFYDLVISDIQMPNINGIDMSKAIYKINDKQKIIIISAYSDKEYLIPLLNIGVEGFLQKPLSSEQIYKTFEELSKSFINNSIINLTQNCTYNQLSKELLCEGKNVNITINENKFIEFLIANHNRTSSIEDIFNYIYYDEPQKEFTNNSIKSLIKRLRKKLPKDLILYNRTTGYTLTLN